MPKKEKNRAVRFRVGDNQQHANARRLPIRTRETQAQTDSSSSLWNLPGLDKDTFYAAALYLHTATNGLEGRLWPRGPKTRLGTRNFLDSLADCFARSKARDASDHVSATAVVRSPQRKQITLYIAKNRSSKPADEAKDKQAAPEPWADENKAFAQQLIGWFNEVADSKGPRGGSLEVDPYDHLPAGDETEGDQADGYNPGGADSESDETDDNNQLENLPPIFFTMCDFSQSRLRHYVEKISEVEPEAIDARMQVNIEEDLVSGWQATKWVILVCKEFQAGSLHSGSAISTSVGLAGCAFLAGKARKNPSFRQLAEVVGTSAAESPLRGFGLPDAIEGVKYLGRLYAAFLRFSNFCRHPRQRHWSFRYVLLDSLQDKWNGASYLSKIRSWTGDLELDEVDSVKSMVNGQTVHLAKTVQQRLDDIVNAAKDTAPVHCEMQLMMHFLRPETPTCLDYFGCSKRSCWLCWHMMVQNKKFSMKHTHRKLYPRWAFPFHFSLRLSNVAEGLRIANNDMMTLVQDKVIKQTKLGSLGPFVQSSARLTPAYRHTEASSFSGDYIGIPNRLELLRLPALHAREDGQLRHVTVAVYKLQKSELDFSVETANYNGYYVTPGFQMITKLGTANSITELNQYQTIRWHRTSFNSPVQEQGYPLSFFYWTMFFRSADFPMQPNPYVLEAWRTCYGEPDKTQFPWRGDIFIFVAIDGIASVNGIPDYLSSPRVVDVERCFQGLVEWFQYFGAGYAEKTRNDNRTSLEDRLRISGPIPSWSSES